MAIDLFYHMPGQSKKTNDDQENLPKEYLEKLGARVKALRIKAGYSSYEFFAYDHNMPRAQWGRYENGQDLRFSSLVKVVQAFGMTLSEFFSEGFEK
ncbi:MAG TPA: helix-turn-helix transcriptional regulator [Candidatus Babeliaceae bacterium]|nr:helix-turn-helix transcriptional regulator [Candidatus Babeliaceae bacterium]